VKSSQRKTEAVCPRSPFVDAPDRIGTFLFHVLIVVATGQAEVLQFFFRDVSEQQQRPATRIGSRCDRLACIIYARPVTNKRLCDWTVAETYVVHVCVR